MSNSVLVRVDKHIHDSKMQFYAHIIDENANNQRVLFLSIGKMLKLKGNYRHMKMIVTLQTALWTFSVTRCSEYV